MDCSFFPALGRSYDANFDVEGGDEGLQRFGHDCGGEFGIDGFHEFGVFLLFVSEGVGVDVYVFLFGVVKHFVAFDFGHEFLRFLLQTCEDGSGSRLLAATEDSHVEGTALRQRGEIDLLLFLFGTHRISYIYRLGQRYNPQLMAMIGEE